MCFIEETFCPIFVSLKEGSLNFCTKSAVRIIDSWAITGREARWPSLPSYGCASLMSRQITTLIHD